MTANSEHALSSLEGMDVGLEQLDTVLHRRHVDMLTEFEVVPSEENSMVDSLKGMRINLLKRVVYDREEDNLDKLKNVLSSVGNYGASCAIILKSRKTRCEIALCTKESRDDRDGRGARDIFQSALQGNFPSVQLRQVKGSDKKDFVTSLKHGVNFLASVTGVPSLKNEPQDVFAQSIEKIVEGLSGHEVSVVLLATPVSREQLELAEIVYQNLYTTLSLLGEQQFTLSENESKTLGATITKTISQGTALTHNLTKTKTKSDFDAKQAMAQGIGGAASGAVAAGAASGGMGAPAGALVGGILAFVHGLFGGSKSLANSLGRTDNSQSSSALSAQDSRTKSIGKSVQYTVKNKRILDLLQLLDEQLERIRECKNLGMWNWGAYFLSEDQVTVETAANFYVGLVSGKRTGLERCAISFWRGDKGEQIKFDSLVESVLKLKHPILRMPEGAALDECTPATLVSTDELAVAMNLPNKSLPGIPVFDSVEFGRAVTTYCDESTSRKLHVGCLSHLGQEFRHDKICLDADSLSSHLFVTGSTGSGKSTAIYSLLHSLWRRGKDKYSVPFLVVEPAKGEYKDVFGGMEWVSVFGTNPYLMPLLHLNPFSFPEEIHITEHIDRLIEILNAIWPMYAAMPAVLKDAVEQSYQRLGWNLLMSQNHYGHIFPDFEDLLHVLPQVIRESDYSEELKSNYTGSLVTRVRSLTNGYYKSIFQKEELSSRQLFDAPCIIDLSRVGSSETKSLLMGVVFMKLQEHRMSQANFSGTRRDGLESANSKLRHITVLEEAHNLLRRTSFGQNQEGANIQGKSVEMISNAIAEMRTYGEGFIIADQAPGLLDPSVIRNTNTKVILRLPDWEDRELVGKSANLKELQIDELARLKTGCAAIYQNEWQEAVLCQFKLSSDGQEGFRHDSVGFSEVHPKERCRIQYLRHLLKCRSARSMEIFSQETVAHYGAYFLPSLKRFEKCDGFDKCRLDNEIMGLINIADITAKGTQDVKLWLDAVITQALQRANGLGENLQLEMIRSIFSHFAARSQNIREREKWIKLEEQYVKYR